MQVKTQELLEQIEQSLKARGFDQEQPSGIYAPIGYTLSLGGKRIRPILCLIASQLFGEELSESLKLALALEVFHNFSLLHDDLMDRSPMRRGKPTVYRKWNENTAILSGDAMCIEAYKFLGELSDPQLLAKVLPLFTQTALEVCWGQQYDMEFETKEEVKLEEYLEMIRLKTAVLLGLSLRLGALAGGASDEEAKLLDRIGQALGLAFQIQDDYLDVYGDEKSFGKPIGGDIMNAKKTAMLLYTKQELQGEDRAELERLMMLSESSREERIEGVRKLYTKAGADLYAKEEIARLTSEALHLLDSLTVSEDRKAPLRQLFDSLASRQS